MQRYYKRLPVMLRCLWALCIICLTGFTGCKDFVQVDPPISGITSGSAYKEDKSAMAVMTSVYGELMKLGGVASGARSIGFEMGQYADELQNWSPTSNSQVFYINSLQNTNDASPLWNGIYTQIYVCNAAIEGAGASGTLSADVKKQILGEARFMRAFLYFYAVNLFGDVPLALVTDYNVNAGLSRSPQAKVYDQIITDLQEAQKLLTDDYRTGAARTTTDKGRPNKQTATALLARVYLYRQDWQHAEEQANAVLADSRYALETEPATVFPPNSKEAIWQMAPVISNSNVIPDPMTYIWVAGFPPDANRPAALSPYLLNAFEPGDKRYAAWVGANDVPATPTVPARTYYFPKKYVRINTAGEYFMVIRVGELLLLRAEARTQLNNLSGARADLDAIRIRAGLAGTTATTKDALLAAILHERQVELFTEWGHRWFDLKRAGKADALMTTITPAKGGIWSSNWLLLPVPVSEILLNRNLSQNPGYPN